MTTVCRLLDTADAPPDAEDTTYSETNTLHEQLVAYVDALAHGSRRGVWGEHSYARGRGAAGAGGARVHVLLAPRAPSPAGPDVDVTRAPSPPPSPPGSPAPASDAEEEAEAEAEEGEWEARAAALAPSAAHARLLSRAAEVLLRMRLERAARGARREQARAAARRLRLALAPQWGAAGWLHAALAEHLPRPELRLYREVAGELARAVPRLARRLAGAAAPARAPAAAPVGPASSPWLVWVSSGCAALDARWERRLAALVHTRVVRGAGGAEGVAAAPPEAWCAAAAGAVRAALTDALAEAGSRAVILGGVGAGAAAALVLARGAGAPGGAAGGVRGCVAAAPPLLTAEGARDARDDALHACRLPLLLVAGTAAAPAARALAHSVRESGAARRLLEVRGADAELRLPRRLRLAKALPQDALDAALVEECVRWAVETAEQEEGPPSPAASPSPERRRAAPLSAVLRDIDLCAEEEYSHLPPAAAPPPPPPHAPPHAPQTSRSLEVVEGRVVSRVSGGTPLALLPPRRGVGGSLAAADIMQLPIVFADDDRTLPANNNADSSPGGSPVTVTSGKPSKRAATDGGGGSVKFTRVILAKRGARGAGAGARRLVLRRGVRLVPRGEGAGEPAPQ